MREPAMEEASMVLINGFTRSPKKPDPEFPMKPLTHTSPAHTTPEKAFAPKSTLLANQSTSPEPAEAFLPKAARALDYLNTRTPLLLITDQLAAKKA